MKNHSIYCGFSTYSHRNPVTFHPQITKKSTLEPVLQLCNPKSRKNHKSDPKVGPKRVPKSTPNRSKSRSGAQGVTRGIPRYPWITQMVSQGPKMDPKVGPKGVPNQPVNQLTTQPVNQSTSTPVNQLPADEGPAAVGEALKFAPTLQGSRA